MACVLDVYLAVLLKLIVAVLDAKMIENDVNDDGSNVKIDALDVDDKVGSLLRLLDEAVLAVNQMNIDHLPLELVLNDVCDDDDVM